LRPNPPKAVRLKTEKLERRGELENRMKNFVIGTLAVSVITVAAGMMQGSLSNRWGTSNSLRRAGDKLETLPSSFSVWEMKRSDKLENDALNQLQPAGYIQRAYLNRNNGAVITVTVLVGSSGPMSVHIPEICLGGRNHQPVGQRQKIAIPGKDGEDTFWKTTFQLNGVDAQMQNVYYAWRSGDHWVAAENPRYSFATKPFLYKIQLASRVPAEKSGESESAADPGLQFLGDFLPVLHNYVEQPN
jgi:hypothetical protein